MNLKFDETAWQNSLVSATTDEFVKPLDCNLGEPICIDIRVAATAPVKAIYLRCAPEGSGRQWQMHALDDSDPFFTTFRLSFTMHWKRFSYRFLILDNSNNIFWFNQMGVSVSNPVDHFDFKLYTDSRIPAWITEKVFYQIFPDRFFNGDSSINYIDGEITSIGEKAEVKTWGDLPKHNFDFFNGDLEGIRQKLDYLSSLGINGIFLNPIFLAPSNHKYDLQDYYQLDPHLGCDQTLINLVGDIHDRGMHIIIDGVFNHVGAAHKWFNRSNIFEQPGAYNDPNSPYCDYFYFEKHPDNYIGWWGFDDLPKLNYASDSLRRHVYKNEDSVIRYWISAPFNIDGWRFDVANMQARQGPYQQGLEVWREVHDAVKDNHPDKYLVGEHFYDGSELTQGDGLDGLINYMGSYYPIYQWLSGKMDFNADNNGVSEAFANFDGQAFYEQAAQYLAQVPFQNALANYNLINSHDRPRMISLLDNDYEKLRTAVIFLFSYVGLPSLYYGDEVALQGGRDPDCRRCFPWDEQGWHLPTLALYKQLIGIRRTHKALKLGHLKWLSVRADSVVYARSYRGQHVITILAVPDPHSGKPLALSLQPLGIKSGQLTSLLDGDTCPIEAFTCQLPLQSGMYLSN